MSDHELWNELGNLYFLSGEYDHAINSYNRSILEDKDFGRPYSNLALTYMRKGEYEKAVRYFRISIERLTNDKEKAISWNRLGDVYRYLKDYQNAVAAFQQADSLDPEGIDRREDSGGLLYASDEFSLPHSNVSEDEAGLQLDQAGAVSSYPGLESSPQNLKTDPSDWRPAYATDFLDTPAGLETDSSIVLSVDEEALEDFQDCPFSQSEEEIFSPELGFEDPSVLLPIPDPPVVEDERLFLDLLSGSEAQVDEAEALSDWDNDENLNSSSMLENRYSLERRFSRKPYHSVDVDVEEPASPAVFVIASSVEEVIASVEAEDALEKPVIPEMDSRSLEMDKDIKVDIARFERVVQINSQNAYAWDNLGNLYKLAGLYAKAIFAYQQAISIDPTRAFFHHHAGLVYAAEGRDEDAIAAFQNVIRLDPDHGLAHAALGGYYRKMGLDELAQKHIGKAMKTIYDSENEYNRACLESICGNVDRALELLDIALTNQQTYVEWVLRDPDLDFIRNDPRFKQLISDHTK